MRDTKKAESKLEKKIKYFEKGLKIKLRIEMKAEPAMKHVQIARHSLRRISRNKVELAEANSWEENKQRLIKKKNTKKKTFGIRRIQFKKKIFL